MYCDRHHELSVLPGTSTTCTICMAASRTNLTCIRCQQSLCSQCVALYKPDTAFAMHLSRFADRELLLYYTKHKDSATIPSRNPQSIAVYNEFQRFYLTDAYLGGLHERIKDAEQEEKNLANEMQRARDRQRATQLELLAALLTIRERKPCT